MVASEAAGQKKPAASPATTKNPRQCLRERASRRALRALPQLARSIGLSVPKGKDFLERGRVLPKRFIAACPVKVFAQA